MREAFSRIEKLIGDSSMEKLANSRVAVFGVGGVGGHAFEALVRSGVGEIDIIDGDVVSESNLNRQIISLRDNIGRPKVDVAEERAKRINPQIRINKYNLFYLPEKREEASFQFEKYDFIVDAIDTVSAKIDIISNANKLGIPIISAMGCGNRLDPTKLVVTDIYKTYNDPLSKIIRKKLKENGVKKLTVVASTELPLTPIEDEDASEKRTPGSTAFVPGAAGLIMASHVIRKLIAK